MMRVGIVFDLHVTRGQRREYDGLPRARRGIEILNEVDPDWTVVGGDLRSFASTDPDRVEWGDWHDDPHDAYYRHDYQRSRDLFEERLESPYRVIRGNHDRPLSVWEEHFPPDEHPRWGVEERDGARYVFLDSNPHEGYHALTQTQNFVSAPQLSMLERLMDDDPDVPTFAFCHAPLARHTDLHPNWDVGRTPAYRYTLNYRSVQHVLERGNTVFVNTGHYSQDHGREAKAVDGVRYVLARHFGKSNPRYSGDVRWMDVDADAREAVVHYHDLSTDDRGVIARATW